MSNEEASNNAADQEELDLAVCPAPTPLTPETLTKYRKLLKTHLPHMPINIIHPWPATRPKRYGFCVQCEPAEALVLPNEVDGIWIFVRSSKDAMPVSLRMVRFQVGEDPHTDVNEMTLAQVTAELRTFTDTPICMDCKWALNSEIGKNCGCMPGNGTEESRAAHDKAFNRARALQQRQKDLLDRKRSDFA